MPELPTVKLRLEVIFSNKNHISEEDITRIASELADKAQKMGAVRKGTTGWSRSKE